MTCVHKVRWTVRPPEDCRFRLSVSHYKDRIVAPDEYSGATVVTPSDSEQVLETKDKLVRDDITVNPAPEPDLRPLSVSENGSYQPDGFDGFSQVSVDVPQPSGSTTITQNGTYDVEQYASAVVDVPAEWTSKGLAEGTEPYGDIDLGDATKIVDLAFQGNSNITGIIGKLVTTGSNAMFRNCGGLKDVHLPRIPTVSQSCFQACVNLKFLFLPSVNGINTYGFSGCTSLETLILTDCANLGRYVTVATNGDENLKTVVLGRGSVVRSSTGFFSGSSFASGGSGGDIYIPKALYDHLEDGSNLDYLSYAEWNTLNSYGTITWHPIEGSEYETYMPGGAKYEEEMALT